MRIILLQDLEGAGKKYDLVEVKDGHARNFLIPQGLAKAATKEALKWAKEQKELEVKKDEEELKKTQKLASTLDGVELVIPVKIGEKGQLFESITQEKIAEKLKESGFNIKKSQILLQEPIKELGEFPLKIVFEHNLETEVRVIVTEDKS